MVFLCFCECHIIYKRGVAFCLFFGYSGGMDEEENDILDEDERFARKLWNTFFSVIFILCLPYIFLALLIVYILVF